MEDLPDEFLREEGLVDVLEMKAAGISTLAQEVGVSAEFLRLAKENPDLVRQFIAAAKGTIEGGAPNGEELQEEEPIVFRDELVAALARPGKLEVGVEDLGPMPPSDPARYAANLHNELAVGKAAEPDLGERMAVVLQRRWEGKDGTVRDFLIEQYGGRCQICQGTFPRRDGEPYFEGLYLVSRLRKRWLDHAGNVLCLCPLCCSKIQYGAVEADGLDEQLASFENVVGSPVLRLILIGEPVEVRFTERHALRLGALLVGDEGN